MSANKKIKLLHLIDTGGQGGAEQVLCSLLENLGGERYEHHLFLPGDGWLYGKLSKLPGVTIVICNGGGRFNIGYIGAIARYVKEHNIQLIHAHLMGTSLYGSIAGFWCRVPVVCTFHGYIDCRPGDRLQRVKLNLIGLFARKIVAVSDSLKDYLVSRVNVGKSKYATIYNGIAAAGTREVTRAEARRQLGLSDADIVIGAVGNVKPAKGYDVLIKAAKRLVDQRCNVKFVIAGNTGTDYYAHLCNLRDSLQLQDKVLFLGFVENTDAFLRALDVFALSSISEGFSLATVEAMNASVPVVATKSGGPQEIVHDGVTGILVDVGDVDALARGLLQIIENPAGAARMVDNAKIDVSARFTIETSVAKYEKGYAELLH